MNIDPQTQKALDAIQAARERIDEERIDALVELTGLPRGRIVATYDQVMADLRDRLTRLWMEGTLD